MELAIGEGSMDRLAAVFKSKIDRLSRVRKKRGTENP
jgi:hypothetical protein